MLNIQKRYMLRYTKKIHAKIYIDIDIDIDIDIKNGRGEAAEFNERYKLIPLSERRLYEVTTVQTYTFKREKTL